MTNVASDASAGTHGVWEAPGAHRSLVSHGAVPRHHGCHVKSLTCGFARPALASFEGLVRSRGPCRTPCLRCGKLLKHAGIFRLDPIRMGTTRSKG